MFNRIRQELDNRAIVRNRIAGLRWRERIISRAISQLLLTRPDGYVAKVRLLALDRDDAHEERRKLQNDLRERSWLKVLFGRRIKNG